MKVNGIDDHITSNNKKDSPLVKTRLTNETTKESPAKPPPPENTLNRRNRFANGSIIRSKSFDNVKYGIPQRKSLNKSKTLSSISHPPKKKRCKTFPENGNADCLGEKNRDFKRRRLFQTAVDQSPLWTTLTHARTISDFSMES